MILDLSKIKIFIRPGVTDMRKQINGLSVIVEEEMNRQAMFGALFIFCNRDRRLIKCIYWDRNGFCLWLKRLEKDRFPWPDNEEQVRELNLDELKCFSPALTSGRPTKKSSTPIAISPSHKKFCVIKFFPC